MRKSMQKHWWFLCDMEHAGYRTMRLILFPVAVVIGIPLGLYWLREYRKWQERERKEGGQFL